jgi:hypothetical protein
MKSKISEANSPEIIVISVVDSKIMAIPFSCFSVPLFFPLERIVI